MSSERDEQRDRRRDAVVRSLLDERTVDIVTTGRRTGRPRTTEIWTTCLFGQVFICGTPNAGRQSPSISSAPRPAESSSEANSKAGCSATPPAGRADIEHQPRDWLANLLANPDFTLRLKSGAPVELAARAQPVTDPDQRRRILTQEATSYYRDAIGLEPAVANSPMVRVTFVGADAWLTDAVRDVME